MKRDWDLIRKILLDLEEHSEFLEPYLDDEADWALQTGDTFFKYCEHVNLLIEAGLVKGVRHSLYSNDDSSIEFWVHVPYGLTWQGHEFIASIREHGAWSKIKNGLKQEGISMSIEIVRAMGKSLLQEKLRKIGVDLPT